MIDVLIIKVLVIDQTKKELSRKILFLVKHLNVLGLNCGK